MQKSEYHSNLRSEPSLIFDQPRQPIPVSLTKKDVKSELERAVSATYMHQNQGTCTYVAL